MVQRRVGSLHLLLHGEHVARERTRQGRDGRCVVGANVGRSMPFARRGYATIRDNRTDGTRLMRDLTAVDIVLVRMLKVERDRTSARILLGLLRLS